MSARMVGVGLRLLEGVSADICPRVSIINAWCPVVSVHGVKVGVVVVRDRLNYGLMGGSGW